MEENRRIEYYVWEAISEALHHQSTKYPDGESITEAYYRKIMREIQSRYVKKESKEIPDDIKGKFIKLPADLKEKYGVIGVIFFDE